MVTNSIHRFSLLFLSTAIFLTASPDRANAQVQHPFMLVNQTTLADLQAKASQEPWQTMKNAAINYCQSLSFTNTGEPGHPLSGEVCPGTPYSGTMSHCLRHIVSYCTTAYIADPTNKQTYVDKIVSVLPRWEDIIIVQSGADDGTRNTTNEFYNIAGSAYFNTLIALDIMQADISARPWVNTTGKTYYTYTDPNDPDPTSINFASELDYIHFLMEQEFNHFYGYDNHPVFNFDFNDNPPGEQQWLYYHMPSRHPPAQEAALMIWKIYTGSFLPSDSDSNALLFGGTLNNGYPDLDGDGKNIGGYLPETRARFNDSGVYSEGPGYAIAGWGSDRDERAHFPDVMEFTGLDQAFGIDFYTDHRWQQFNEWLYGYALTPFGMITSFGDAYAYRLMTDQVGYGKIFGESSRLFSAGKYSSLAGSYAHRMSRGQTPEGLQLSYILYTPDPGGIPTAPSKIYDNGGGFFQEQPADDFSLYGVLWSVRKPTEGSPVFHIRDDVNAIYIAGYGAPLLMNSGFCGSSSPSGPDGCGGSNELGTNIRYAGEYLGNRAVANNTALINYTLSFFGDGTSSAPYSVADEGNLDKFGSGTLEGFTNPGFDYTSASTKNTDPSNSYTALADGEHIRNLFFIHPDNGSSGYFVTFDEFKDVSGGTVHLAFHPNSRQINTISQNTEYDALVGRRAFASEGTGLSFFFGTQPSQDIQFERGIIATAGSIGSYVPEFFFITYPVRPDGTQNIATILFPFNESHQKAQMTRITGSNYSGATLNHGGQIMDTAIVSHESNPASLGNFVFQGKSAIARFTDNTNSFYFVRQGTGFSTQPEMVGFNSVEPVSIYLAGNTGSIISQGTRITIKYPGLLGLRLDNTDLTPTNTGYDWVEADIPVGTYNLELITDSTPTPSPTPHVVPGDTDSDGDVDLVDYQTLLDEFNTTNCGGSCVADFDNDGSITIFDFNILVTHFGS
jgi:hypothetical protein